MGPMVHLAVGNRPLSFLCLPLIQKGITIPQEGQSTPLLNSQAPACLRPLSPMGWEGVDTTRLVGKGWEGLRPFPRTSLTNDMQ